MAPSLSPPSSSSSVDDARARPSPDQFPSGSRSQHEPSTSELDRLITHLLASKRSLSSIHQAHHATKILSRARADLESSTILAARNAFSHTSFTSQLKLLRRVQFELEDVAQNTQAEFNSELKELDETGQRLDRIVERLRETQIDPGFRGVDLKSSGRSGDGPVAAVKTTLHDFVDDAPVEELKDSVKASIDAVQHAKKEMDRSLHDFEEDLQAVNHVVGAKTAESSSASSTFQPPNIPAIIRALENHAREVAESLESLVTHFDLCVTAIRHTEGGGAAVAKNLDVDELPEGIDVKNIEAPAYSITEEEKKGMMAVLDNDAAEVEEVVAEIQDRVSQMEAQLDHVQLWKEKQETESEDVVAAMELLERVGSNLSGYVSQSQGFLNFWAEERLRIGERMRGLEELRHVYRGFLHAYDGLIVEVARRRAVRNQMDKVVREAQSKLRLLYDDDLEEREAFRLDQGEFLPVDIWSGLSDPPPEYAFARVGDVHESVPDLPRKAVEEALKRLRATSPRP